MSLINIWGMLFNYLYTYAIHQSKRNANTQRVKPQGFSCHIVTIPLQVARTHPFDPFYVTSHLGKVFSTVRCYQYDILDAHTPNSLVLGQYLLVYEP